MLLACYLPLVSRPKQHVCITLNDLMIVESSELSAACEKAVVQAIILWCRGLQGKRHLKVTCFEITSYGVTHCVRRGQKKG